MKPIKSIALLAAGALAFSACSKKPETTVQKETSMSTTAPAAVATPVPPAVTDDTTSTRPYVAPVRTSQGSGAVSDEAATEDLRDDEYVDETEEDFTDQGTGASVKEDEMEYVDETASEPNNVRGGRDPRLLEKQNDIHHSASEPLETQE